MRNNKGEKDMSARIRLFTLLLILASSMSSSMKVYSQKIDVEILPGRLRGVTNMSTNISTAVWGMYVNGTAEIMFLVRGCLDNRIVEGPPNGSHIRIQITGPENMTNYTYIQDQRFTIYFTPTKAGMYTVQAIYDGDSLYNPSIYKMYIIAQKIPTSLTISASPSEGSIDMMTRAATVITISGKITFLRPGFTYSLGLSTPLEINIVGKEETIKVTVISSSDGSFSTSFTPTSTGYYTITTSFLGNDIYDASSEQISINVSYGYTSLIVSAIIIITATVGSMAYLRRKSKP